jgi:3-oxoadipate enol-lactonase
MTLLHDSDLRTDRLHVEVLGRGEPVTVLAHGLGGSTSETRPLASRLLGTRVLFDFRGHGRSASLAHGWEYDGLAADLLAVADAVGATRAVGLSLGSGALLRLLSESPGRFERLAFVMPAALDATRVDGATVRLRRLGAAIDGHDVDAVVDLLLAEVPPSVRDRRGTRLLLTRRAAQMVERPAPQPRHDDRPVLDRRALRDVGAPSLVVTQAGDPLHPHEVAQDLVTALPAATLMELPHGGVFWTAARTVQDALAQHLTPEPS